VQSLRHQGVNGVKDIFADLSIFRLNVNETKTSTIATICGIQEQGEINKLINIFYKE
jgi:hypothetical protein